MKSWLIAKDLDVGKDWRQEEKGMTEDEMVGWHHRLDGHGFEQIPADGEGQGRLECCSSWGRKEWDTTGWLNNNNYPIHIKIFPVASKMSFIAVWFSLEPGSKQRSAYWCCVSLSLSLQQSLSLFCYGFDFWTALSSDCIESHVLDLSWLWICFCLSNVNNLV